VDEVGELGRITNEEDGCVVEYLKYRDVSVPVDLANYKIAIYPVPIALLRFNFNRESTGVTSSISGTRLASDSRETNGRWGFVAYFAEDLSGRDMRNVVGDCSPLYGKLWELLLNPSRRKLAFKVSVGTSTCERLSVSHATIIGMRPANLSRARHAQGSSLCRSARADRSCGNLDIVYQHRSHGRL
jgi:hypothetical protein